MGTAFECQSCLEKVTTGAITRWFCCWRACHTSVRTWVQIPSTHIKGGCGDTRTCTHTHTGTHTCIHTHTHICTYSHMHAYTHTPSTLVLVEKQGQVDSLSQSSQSVSLRFSERSCLTMLHGPTCVCTCVDTHYTHAQREGNSVKKWVCIDFPPELDSVPDKASCHVDA